MQWVAMYSHTGYEARTIRKAFPESGCEIWHGAHRALMEQLRAEKPDLVTLHGYMGLIPDDLCASNMLILNGHPALITRYKELRGKDPQQRAWYHRRRYHAHGVVIHRVSSALDGGPVLASSEIIAPLLPETFEEYDALLRRLMANLWKEVLPGAFKNCSTNCSRDSYSSNA